MREIPRSPVGCRKYQIYICEVTLEMELLLPLLISNIHFQEIRVCADPAGFRKSPSFPGSSSHPSLGALSYCTGLPEEQPPRKKD